jgi:iron complex outermembrane recepter protein
MKTIKKIFFTVLAMNSLMTFSQDVKQDSIKAKKLNEVEVTATSNTDKSLINQPASISKIETLELQRGNGLFLDDAINANMPGVYMQRRTIAAGQQFNIRGYGNGIRGTNGANSNFDTQGSKVYLNNIPITDAEGITLMDDIDFNSIGNVEILKGPAGSLYGLAIAGVVNLKTIKPEKGKTSIGQNSLFGSYGLQRYTTQLQIGGEKSSLLVNYGQQKFAGFMDHTASNKDFVNVFADFQPSEKQNISAYFGYSDSYDQRNGELTVKQYQDFDYTGNPAYIKNDAHSNVISFRAGLSHTYQFCKNVSNSTTFFGSGISSNVSSAGGWTDKLPVNYGFRSTFDLNFELTEDYLLSGVTGIEMQRQNAQTIGYPMIKDPNPGSSSQYNIIGAIRSNLYTVSKTTSLFTEWTLAMPHDFALTAGIGSSTMGIELNDRFYVAPAAPPATPTYKTPYYEVSYNNMFSPHLAINKVFNKQLSVYASYSKGYKAPVSSYFYIPTAPSGVSNTIGLLNNGLKPEIGNQYEIGSKGTLLKQKLIYQLAYFNAIFSDKMTVVAVPNAANTATSYTYVTNGGTQDHKGIEALLKYTIYESDEALFKSVAPFVNAAYSDFKYKDFKFQQLNGTKDGVVEVDYSGNKVAGVPALTFNAGLDFVTKYGFYGNINHSYRGTVYFTSDAKNKAVSFNVLNAKIGFQKRILNHLDLDASLGANNITESQYYQMLFVNQLPDAYLPAPNKINYFGGLNVKYIF